MKVVLENIGKQYAGEWIFKSVSLSFFSGEKWHLSGNNGAGKSTLLKVIAGLSTPSLGEIFWENNKQYSKDNINSQLAICAPFCQLLNHHTLLEAVSFHLEFKPLLNKINPSELLEIAYLSAAAQKKINQLSSGMLQRLKLALSILSDTPILLLDEPCMNLDQTAISWYQELLKKNCENRLLIVSSNNKTEEHFICEKTINLADYKN